MKKWLLFIVLLLIPLGFIVERTISAITTILPHSPGIFWCMVALSVVMTMFLAYIVYVTKPEKAKGEPK